MALLAFTLVMLVVAGVGRAQTNAHPAGKVYFRNGDSLAGGLVSASSREGLTWHRTDAQEPMTFKLSSINSIDVGATPPAPAWQSVSHRVRLRGEDLVEGVVESCDSDSVRIVTPSAGVLTAPRAALLSISVMPPPEVAIYEGPTGLDGWTQGSSALTPFSGNQWTYRSGAFYAANSGSIARDLRLPPMACIQFDLRWQSQFQVNVALYADSAQPVSLLSKDNEPAFGGFYSLQLNNSVANLMAVKQVDPLRSFDAAIIQTFIQSDRMHVDLRVNTNRASIILLLDGVMIKEWIDPTGFIGRGTMLRFVNGGNFGPVKISNLRITRWDGVLGERPPTDPSGTQDVIRLSDDSAIMGRLMAITNATMTIASGQGVVEVPLSRLRQLDFAKAAPPPGAIPDAVRVYFGQTSHIITHLDQYDRKTFQGQSLNFDKVQIDGASITRLQMLR